MVSSLHPILTLLLAICLITAAVTDIRARRIPNWLTAATLLAGFGGRLALENLAGARSAALGLAVALAIYLPLYLLRAIGGGDVKLMAGVGAIAGPQNWLVIFVFSSVAGGVWALLLAIARGAVLRAVVNIAHIVREVSCLRMPFDRRPELDAGHPAALTAPHAASIAIGAGLFVIVA